MLHMFLKQLLRMQAFMLTVS